MATTLESFLIDIGWEIQGDKATTESDKILERMRGQSERAAQSLANTFKRASLLAVGAVAAIGGAAAAALNKYVELGAEVGNTAQKLNIGTTELQRLQAATKASGGEVSALKDALKTMTVGFQEAATKGSGPFWEGLKLVGVQIEELEGMNSEQQIGLLADALNEIKDPADRTATSLKLFGEAGGLELGGLLSRGSAGIRELGDEAERTGVIMSERAVKGAQALKASLGQVEAVGASVVARVGEKLAPKLSELADGALAWADANEAWLTQDLPAMIEDLISAIGSLVAWLVDVSREFKQFGKDVELVAIELSEFATGIADAARQISDFLEPAVDAALTPLRLMAGAFVTIQETVVDVVAQILELVGVLDDVKAAYNRLPVVGSGGVPEGYDNAAGSAGRGPAAFLGGGSQAEFDAVQEARRANAAALASPGAMVAGRIAQAAAEALSAEGRQRAATSASRGAARAAGRAALAPPKSGGGGGKSAKAASAGKGGILDKLGLGGLFEDHSGTGLAGLLGIGGTDHAPAGGGSSPLAGATFATQEVNTHAEITINLPASALEGLSSRDQAELIRATIQAAVDEQNRRALDYVSGPMRRG